MSQIAAPSRLLLLAPNWLGDAIMALPLIADLHRAWPQTTIEVAARATVARLYEMIPAVARTIELEGRTRPRQVAHHGAHQGAHARDIAALAAGRFDATVVLPNSFLAAWLVWRAGIAERWGFAREWRRPLLTRAWRAPIGSRHQAAYYQRLATLLGVVPGEPYASLAIAPSSLTAARDLLRAHGIAESARLVIFAPGAAYGSAKQWPPSRFVELAHQLASQQMVTVLVGAAADRAACAHIAALAPVVDLAGKTNLPVLAALMSTAAHVVANDSGAMHLAAAAGARVTAIFGPTNEAQTSPLRSSHAAPAPAIVTAKVFCRPCLLRECPIDHRCMIRISASRVFDTMRATQPIQRDASSLASQSDKLINRA